MFDMEHMREQVLRMADPNDPYTEEDFNKEFSGPLMTDDEQFKMNFNFKNESSNADPEYATTGSSGFDLRASLSQKLVIPIGKRAMVPTGLYFELPEGLEIQVRPRSGLAAKNGVTVLNTPGTIDADYRGEIKVILINLGEEPFEITNGDRIAQAVVASVIGKKTIKLNKVNTINENTERGVGGFGSTGKK